MARARRNQADTSIGRRKPAINRQILRWYAKSGRVLPWRGEKNPYRILISEVMLQQTQVSRVLHMYPRFLRQFPNFSALAKARTSTVIRAWKGMGYNNRAVRLQQLATRVIGEYNRKLPASIDELRKLPGIGEYSAHAIACLAFGQHVPVVDTNIRRVLGRLFPKHTGKLDIWELAGLALTAHSAHHWNQALMDLGATICTSSNPKCNECPVTRLCPSSFRVRRMPNVRSNAEPSRDGLPNRIYRGRIVDALRHTPGGEFIPFERLGRKVKNSYSGQDRRWLEHLMKDLERDGLVVVKKNRRGFFASLPQ